MALLKHTVTTSIRNDAGGGISDVAVYQADAEVNGSDTILAGHQVGINVDVDVSQIESFFIESDQALTVKTNSETSPAQSFSLAAKRALWWNVDRLDTNPLTVDITLLVFDNSLGSNDANIKFGFLLNLGS
jgi:hypothetical protein